MIKSQFFINAVLSDANRQFLSWATRNRIMRPTVLMFVESVDRRTADRLRFVGANFASTVDASWLLDWNTAFTAFQLSASARLPQPSSAPHPQVGFAFIPAARTAMFVGTELVIPAIILGTALYGDYTKKKKARRS